MHLNINRRNRTLPAGIVLTVLACAVHAAFAAEVTDLGAVGAADSSRTTSVPAAAKTAPAQSSLDARSAQTEVSDEFVRNYTSPVSDYTQVVQMAPGMFSYSPNGVGLGDSKTTMRGFADGNSVISFDGIPFNDTNGVSHHSWVFFPSQFTSGAIIQRGAGSAKTIGQATFAGSIDLQSRTMESKERTSVTGSFGTWNTSLVGVEHETGQFGTDGASNLLFNVQEMKSQGYQTLNDQDRQAVSIKYQYALSANTVLTGFTSYLNLKNNTPNTKGVTRYDAEKGNYNYLLQNTDPTLGNFDGYNFYDVSTNFSYAGISSSLSNGWKVEDKVYVYRYWNKQNYNNTGITLQTTGGASPVIVAGARPVFSSITTTSAVDKLNSYVTSGNLLRVTQESKLGTLSLGLWYDHAKSYRFQKPSDPKTWIDQAAPNFSETYTTDTVQPYIEYEFNVAKDLKITPGVKYASYKQSFNHLQDNGGAVGPLGGTFSKTTGIITGGAPSVSNSVTYHDTMPSLDAHYLIQPNWSTYAQYAVGDQIPSTSVYDTPNAKVTTPPKVTKSTTFTLGTVWKSDKYILDADVFHTKLDSPYSSTIDSATGNPVYFLNGSEINKGVELAGNVVLGGGFSVYANGTVSKVTYNTGFWVAGAPNNTETLGLNYQNGGWDMGWFTKRIGTVYADNKAVHQAYTIDPVTFSNLFINYTVGKPGGFMNKVKFQLGVNNVFGKHSIVDVAAPGTVPTTKPATPASSSANPLQNDLLTLLPGRSVNFTVSIDF